MTRATLIAAGLFVSAASFQKSPYNDIARFIAGLPAGTGSALPAGADWWRFSETFDKRWQAYETSSLEKIRAWRDRELPQVNEDSTTVFYPFSGPDFINMYTFFPDAERYVMVGLEPVGTLPTLSSATVEPYLGALSKSLNSVMRFSFFRTNDLAVDLKSGKLDGALHVLLLFLARTGNRVTDVRPVTVGPSGSIVASRVVEGQRAFPELVGAPPPTAGGLRAPNPGVEILFDGPSGARKMLVYFSVNLSDNFLKKNPDFVRYVEGLGPVTTYVKSASYLMHKPYFSVVRSAILAQSRHVLQDDSGLPFRAFTPDEWNVKLYGAYDRPIALFTAFHQQDLRMAYRSQDVAALEFGIGYQYRFNHSNLLLATRKAR